MILRWNKQSLTGEPLLPASKSISNRLLIIRAVSKKHFSIENLSDAQDTQNLYSNLKFIQQSKQPALTVDVGPAGTNMRFLTAFLAFQEGQEFMLKGTERMHQRPVAPLVSALRDLGADIEYLEHDGYPPLRIRGIKPQKSHVTVASDTSSQFITALMLIAPAFPEGLQIELAGEPVSLSYIRMTGRIMEKCGAEPEISKNKIVIKNHNYHPPESFFAEPDWSAASYWYGLLSAAKEGWLRLKHLPENSVQGDSILHQWMKPFGIKTTFTEAGAYLEKDVTKEKTFFAEDFLLSPDLAQTFLALAAAKGIHARLSGLKTLRLKETDRLTAMQAELKKFGIRMRKTEDQAEILPQKLTGNPETICTYDDHRMAMAMAIMAVKTGEITIENPGVVKKSYPHFWKELARLGFDITEESS